MVEALPQLPPLLHALRACSRAATQVPRGGASCATCATARCCSPRRSTRTRDRVRGARPSATRSGRGRVQALKPSRRSPPPASRSARRRRCCRRRWRSPAPRTTRPAGVPRGARLVAATKRHAIAAQRTSAAPRRRRPSDRERRPGRRARGASDRPHVRPPARRAGDARPRPRRLRRPAPPLAARRNRHSDRRAKRARDAARTCVDRRAGPLVGRADLPRCRRARAPRPPRSFASQTSPPSRRRPPAARHTPTPRPMPTTRLRRPPRRRRPPLRRT